IFIGRPGLPGCTRHTTLVPGLKYSPRVPSTSFRLMVYNVLSHPGWFPVLIEIAVHLADSRPAAAGAESRQQAWGLPVICCGLRSGSAAACNLLGKREQRSLPAANTRMYCELAH